MRRTRTIALSLILAAGTALGSASSVYSSTPAPAIHLGLLNAKDSWKVGTVNSDAPDAAYCAMVGHFDKEVVLAFARNPEGFGSAALDFRDRFFEAGQEYDVVIETDTIKKTFKGAASGERSLVVQIGQDESFYASLAKAQSANFILPALQVSFPLARFETAYGNLVNCARQLQGAEPIRSAQAPTPQAPTPLEAPAVAAAPVEDVVVLATTATMAKASSEPAASASTLSPVATAATSPVLAAQEAALARHSAALEQRAKALDNRLNAQVKQDATIQKTLREKEENLIELASTRARKVESASTSFSVREQELQAQVERLQQERNDLDARLQAYRGSTPVTAIETHTMAEENKSLKAQLVAKQAEIAQLSAQRLNNTQNLTSSLAGTGQALGGKIATLEAEVASLRQQAAEADHLRAELQQQKEENARLLASLQATREQLAQSEARYQTALADKRDIEQRLAAIVQNQTNAAPAEIARMQAELNELKAAREQNMAQIGALEQRNLDLERRLAMGGVASVATASAVSASSPVQPSGPAVAAVPTTAVAAETLTPAATHNRAAAFLEKVMTAHRPAGYKASTLTAAAAPTPKPVFKEPATTVAATPTVVEAAASPVMPSVVSASPVSRDLKIDQTPDQPAVLTQRVSQPPEPSVSMTARQDYLPDEPRVLAAVGLTAASAMSTPSTQPSVAPVLAAPIALAAVPQETAQKISAQELPPLTLSSAQNQDESVAQDQPLVLSRPVPPVVRHRSSGPLSLEALLQQSGIEVSSFVPVATLPGEVVTQWNSGNLTGMYEQMDVPIGSSFEEMVSAYLNRYRSDCASGLKVDAASAQAIADGAAQLSSAVITCDQPGNSYATSMLFTQRDGVFAALLHSGYPDDELSVRQRRDALAAQVRLAGGIAAKQPAVRKYDLSRVLQKAPGAPEGKQALEQIETIVVE